MQKHKKEIEETSKKPAEKPQRKDRKSYVAPKLTVHGNLGQITAGSGHTWQPSA